MPSIKKFRPYFIFLIMLACIIYLNQEPLYTPTALLAKPQLTLFPKIIAHKAMISGKSQGNSLPALQEAMGSAVDGLEVDVRLSQDNILFVYHGETLEEDTNGHGKPENHSWAELADLHYKSKHLEKLIKLEDVFKIVGAQKYLFLDIKSNPVFNKKMAVEISRLIKQYSLQESIIVESFNPIFLINMRLTDRDILLMYDFTMDSIAYGEELQSQFDQIPWLLKQPFIQKQVRRLVRPDLLGPRFNLPKSLMQSLIQDGYPIIVWTVDDPLEAQKLFALGITGLETNKPLIIGKGLSQAQQNLFDAGGTKAHPDVLIHVHTAQDVIAAIKQAHLSKRKITISGRRHSMGGQALLDNSIHLDMLSLNHVSYDPKSKIVTAEAGASWKEIQLILDQYNRSIKVMQSDNIFTVGGSVSVNVHGWQVGSPPIAETIRAMTVVTADGKVRRISNSEEAELFRAVIGGYGMFAVIISVEIETVENSRLQFHAVYMQPENFAENYKKFITHNSKVELAYARLSVAENDLFNDVGLFWYEKLNGMNSEKMQQERMVAVKRAIFRSSEYFDEGKKLRWTAEKLYAKELQTMGALSRNNAMQADIHILWPLYGSNVDILHEYFIPKNKVMEFLRAFKKDVENYHMNLMNVTIREVRKDTISLLPYAQQDDFAFVCYFSQGQSPRDEARMHEFTQKVVQDVLDLNGTFYLPYRQHYSKEELRKAYPELNSWIILKRKWDPNLIFYSDFFKNIQKSESNL